MDQHSKLFQQAAVEAEIARGDDLVFIGWMQQSLRGDASLIPAVAHQIGYALVHEDHIPANYRIWLALALAKLQASPEVARIISGSKRRGAPRKGLQSQVIACEVMDAIWADGATSVEAACAAVAEARHISPDAAKKHWESNQDVLWHRYGEDLRIAGFADLRDACRAATADNRTTVKK